MAMNNSSGPARGGAPASNSFNSTANNNAPSQSQSQSQQSSSSSRANAPDATKTNARTPNAASNFQAASASAKTPEKTRSTQEVLEQARANAQRRHTEVIQKMNDQRPKPQLTLVNTPTGTTTQEVHTKEGEKKNREIDAQIQSYKDQMTRLKGRGRDGFSRGR